MSIEFNQAPLISCAFLFGGVTGGINYTVHRSIWGTGTHKMSDISRKAWQAMTAVAGLVASAAFFVGLMVGVKPTQVDKHSEEVRARSMNNRARARTREERGNGKQRSLTPQRR